MKYYFPSCNMRAQFPVTVKAIASYMEKKGIRVVNCCRVCKDQPDSGDEILSVCTSCKLILSENRPDCKVGTLYDQILSDPDFSVPDLKGRHFVLQDCAKADPAFKESVRKLLDALHVDYEISGIDDFCGRFMMSKIPARNMEIAPEAFSALEEKITIQSGEEQDRVIQNTADSYEGKEVLVYCNSCHRSLKSAGANVIHLAELLFSTQG